MQKHPLQNSSTADYKGPVVGQTFSPLDLPRFAASTTDTQGHFYWQCKSAKELDFLVRLGVMPTNNILTNQLINIFGGFVLKRLKYLATDNDVRGFFAKKGPLTSLKEFTDCEQIEIALCDNMTKKLRQLQDIDLLLNQVNAAPNESSLINQLKSDLAELYPQRAQPITYGSLNSIFHREHKEYEYLSKALDQLKIDLEKAHGKRARNDVLIKWQREVYLRLISNFQRNQGQLSARQHWLHPLPLENSANTQVTQDAYYCLQDYTYNEYTPITSEMLWQPTDFSRPMALYSGNYTHHPKNLLFATTLCEALEGNLGITIEPNNACSKVIEARSGRRNAKLAAVKSKYDQNKQEVERASLQAKAAKSTNNGLEKRSPPILQPCYEMLLQTLSPSSLIRQKGKQRRDVSVALNVLKVNENVLATKGLDLATKDLINSGLPEALKDVREVQTKPQPLNALINAVDTQQLKMLPLAQPHRAFKAGDMVSAVLNFTYSFFKFFDSEMMAKRPYVSAALFSVPFIQFASAALALTGYPKLAAVNEMLSVAEANLLNGLGAHTSATGISEAVKTACNGLLWFTDATSPLQVVVVAGFVMAKGTYSIGDAIFNLFGNQETVLQDLFKEVSGPDTLAGRTGTEKAKDMGISLVKFIAATALAGAYGIGAHLSHSAILEFLGHVPLDYITHPKWQTIGSIKTLSLLIGKIAGVNHFINQGHLLDVDGSPILPGSTSHQIIHYFIELCNDEDKRESIDVSSNHFQQVREHFEMLMYQNPQLYQSLFKQDSLAALSNLGVTQIEANWHYRARMIVMKILLSILESLSYAGLGLIGLVLFIRFSCSKDGLPRPLKMGLLVMCNWMMAAAQIMFLIAKSVLHPFLELLIRVPEVPIHAISCVIAIVVLLVEAAVSCYRSLVELLSSSHAYHQMAENNVETLPREQLNYLERVQRDLDYALYPLRVAGDWMKENVRYPVKHAATDAMVWVRDNTARPLQRKLQQAMEADLKVSELKDSTLSEPLTPSNRDIDQMVVSPTFGRPHSPALDGFT